MLEISEIMISAADDEGEVIDEDELCYIVGECNHNGQTPIVGIWLRTDRGGEKERDKLLGRFYPDELIKAAKIIKTADYRRDE
ncbi:MAG: hypothetical protein IH921_05770 [Gemmatimonadetes bacterium]|nr:hypothetical protein [Gemmatimonadota bacterium]